MFNVKMRIIKNSSIILLSFNLSKARSFIMEYLSLLSLSILRAVIELGSFKAAAQHLNISQPAVSSHIRRMEDYLGCNLFKRTAKQQKSISNRSRESVIPVCGRYILQNKEILSILEQMNTGEWGEIRFASSIGTYVMLSLISSYMKLYPNVNSVIRTCNSAKAKTMVLHGEVDFGLSVKANDHRLFFQPFYREPMVLLCGKDHPLAETKSITKNDLESYGLVTCLDGSDYNNLVYSYLTSLGITKVKNNIQIEEGAAILKLLENGEGISFLASSTAGDSLRQGNIVSLSLWDNIEPPYIDVILVFRDKSTLNKATRSFVKFIYATIGEKYPFITMLSKIEDLKNIL